MSAAVRGCKRSIAVLLGFAMLAGTALGQSAQAGLADAPSPHLARSLIESRLQVIVVEELAGKGRFDLVEVDRIRLHQNHVETVAWGLIGADQDPLMVHFEVDLDRQTLHPRRWLARQIDGAGVLLRRWSSDSGAVVLAAK